MGHLWDPIHVEIYTKMQLDITWTIAEALKVA